MKEAFAFVFNVVLHGPNFREVEIIPNVLLKSARLCLHKKLVSCYQDGACNSMMPTPSLQGCKQSAEMIRADSASPMFYQFFEVRLALDIHGQSCQLQTVS